MSGDGHSSSGDYVVMGATGLTRQQKFCDWVYLTAAATCIYTVAWYLRSFSVYNSEKQNVVNNAVNSLSFVFCVSIRDVVVTAKLREAQHQYGKGCETGLDGAVALGATGQQWWLGSDKVSRC